MKGWRYESQRHALAAKGVRTAGFYSWKDALAESIQKGTADPGDEEVRQSNLRVRDEQRAEVLRIFRDAVKRDEVRPEKEDDLLREYGYLSRAFLERKEMDAAKFRERSRELAKDFVKRSQKRLKILDWGEGQ